MIDVRITDVDAKSSNRSEDSDKVFEAHEREKKKKHLGACLKQRRHFSPFVVSTNVEHPCGCSSTSQSAMTRLKTRNWALQPDDDLCCSIEPSHTLLAVRCSNKQKTGDMHPRSFPSKPRDVVTCLTPRCENRPFPDASSGSSLNKCVPREAHCSVDLALSQPHHKNGRCVISE
jgi:hypothetical protein